MKCFNCGEALNPTLVYCSSCGVPVDTDPEEVFRDEEERIQADRAKDGAVKVKGLFFTSLFVFLTVAAFRYTIIKEQRFDYFTSYHVPYAVVEKANIDPPTSIKVNELPIPLPSEETGGDDDDDDDDDDGD